MKDSTLTTLPLKRHVGSQVVASVIEGSEVNESDLFHKRPTFLPRKYNQDVRPSFL